MDQEPSGSPPESWIKRNLHRAIDHFRGNRSQPPEVQTRQNIKETPQDMSREEVNMIFTRIENLLRGADPSKLSENFTLLTHGGGSIEAKAMAELISAQESFDLSDANVGDVVWWRDSGGGSAFYLITEPYELDIDKSKGHQYKHGKGIISGEVVGEKLDKAPAVIEGAGFGIVKMGAVGKNLPVNFIVQERENPSFGWWKTNPVTSFGVIKSERIRGSGTNPGQKR